MSGTPRLSLPFLSPGQAQKEFFFNESLQTLDVLVAGAVEELRDDPPSAPVVGTAYIVGDTPTSEWTGKGRNIAAYSAGGWRFIAAVDGLRMYIKAYETIAIFRTGIWEVGKLRCSEVLVAGQQVIGARGAGVALASGGATIDAEARAAIEEILVRMRTHGLIDA